MNRAACASRLFSRAALATAALLLPPAVPRAETLADAITAAYRTNPTLQAQRAQLMSVDEGYVQARAALGPTVSLQGTAQYTQNRLGYLSPTEANFGQVQLTVTQPLYTGGRNALNLSAARAQIDAARQALRVTEGNVVLAVVQAYVDVTRDAAALAVRQINVQVLSDEVIESRARERGGEVTRTDVAQAETQLAGERALLSSARGQLQADRAQYATLVGQNPGTLTPAPALPGLPGTIDEAFRVADGDSPELQQAKSIEAGSQDRVRAARAAQRPSVSASIVAGYLGSVRPFDERNVRRSVTGQVTVTQPIFTGGLLGSQIRQALDQNTADRLLIETSRRSVVQSVANAWNQMMVSDDNVGFQRENVRAAQAAFTGMRIEQRAGQRATLDVLITEQNLVNARLLLLAADHDRYLAQATLLRTMGRLEGQALMADLPKYDPDAHLRHVRHKGAVPWAPIIEAVDSLGAPGLGKRRVVGPRRFNRQPALRPAQAAPSGPLVEDLPLSNPENFPAPSWPETRF